MKSWQMINQITEAICKPICRGGNT